MVGCCSMFLTWSLPTFYFLRRMHLFGEEDKTGTAAPALLANLEELFSISLTQ